MAHVALCWELGGGLGHAGRLAPLAQELERRGHRVTLVLRDLVQTEALLAGTGLARVAAPVWLHRVVGVPAQQVSMGEILLGCGYLDARGLQGLTEGWLGTLRLLRPDLVVCDYAPTATLAARILDVPTATVGIGFFLPPPDHPMPAFRDWEPIAPGRVEHAESRALASVNHVLALHGAAPLDRLAPVLHGDHPFLCTWPELDHYRRVPGTAPAYHGPSIGARGAGLAPVWPAGEGAAVFAYLKAGHPDHAEVLRALDAAGLRTLCYLPEVASGKAPPLLSPRIAYADAPVDLDAAFAGAALAVCHAGEATAAQAILHGVPLLLLPMQAEQFLISRRMEEHGLGINAAQRRRPTDWPGLTRMLLDEPRWRDRAASVARRYAGHTQATQTRTLVDAFETLIV